MIPRVLPLQGAFALASVNRFVPQEDFLRAQAWGNAP
jgi:hypothetical protein